MASIDLKIQALRLKKHQFKPEMASRAYHQLLKKLMKVKDCSAKLLMKMKHIKILKLPCLDCAITLPKLIVCKSYLILTMNQCIVRQSTIALRIPKDTLMSECIQ